MTHPNYMVAWDEIRCQRGALHPHESRRVQVVLGGPTGYRDCPPIPKRFARHYEMEVWDPLTHPVDGGAYCPAHDAVSATIVSHGVWEPRETILALHVLTSAAPGSGFLDIGAQLGWYSLLAASCGVPAVSVDAEAENLRLLRCSLDANGWSDLVKLKHERVCGDEFSYNVDEFLPFRIALAKIDIEGAEATAINALWPRIASGLVDHILMEVSPVFAEGYPELVVKLVDAGYRAYTLPPRQRPPISLLDLSALEPYRIDTLGRDALAKTVASWHQEDVFFVREAVAW